MKILIPILFLFFSFKASAQDSLEHSIKYDFKDTIGNIVFDSLTHRFGTVNKIPKKMIKRFKYLGGDQPLFITKTRTRDPGFICKYPKEPLKAGEIYELEVCLVNRSGSHYQRMGIILSDGRSIYFKITAKVKEKKD